jgi:hypothetical protein
VENKTLINWVEGMIPIKELQECVYPTLHVLDPLTWESSSYRSFEDDSELKDHYHSLLQGEQGEVSQALKEASDADLAEILNPTEKEVNTRRGLALIEHTRERLLELDAQITRQLRMYQSVRDHAMIEMERRARVNMVKQGGEHLDAFVSRFIFGPDVAPLRPYPNLPVEQLGNEPKPRTFIRARVKSGKTIYVEHLTFDIPDVYHDELLATLKEAKLIAASTSSHYYSYYSNVPPLQTDQKIARVYYKMGFKPKPVVTINYRCHWYNSSWNNGWTLGRSRQMKTSELEPIE